MKMSSLKFSMIFVFLLSLLTFTIAADPTYLYHVCSKFNFTRNSTYLSNLNLLLSSLPSNANHSNGFSNAIVGQDPNRVYGLFQCRGDVTTATCKNCVAFASTYLAQRCPAQKRAVIWYDECLVHYSDSYIFSTAASSPSVQQSGQNFQYEKYMKELVYIPAASVACFPSSPILFQESFLHILLRARDGTPTCITFDSTSKEHLTSSTVGHMISGSPRPSGVLSSAKPDDIEDDSSAIHFSSKEPREEN